MQGLHFGSMPQYSAIRKKLNDIKSGCTLERHFKDFIDNNMMLPHHCNLVDKEDIKQDMESYCVLDYYEDI
eukprot:8884617-Ditylum_brightwellii.AAC.1